MTDPKPITEAEVRTWMERGVQAIEGPVPVLTRLLATAQAATEADSLRAQLAEMTEAHDLANEASRLQNEMLLECEKEAESAEAALTAAQGEVAVLREALMSSGGSCGTCVKSSLSSRTCERGTNGCDVRHWQTDEAKAALVSTRATADAHDERVRRKTLEDFATKLLTTSALPHLHAGHTDAARWARALAHPEHEEVLFCAQCWLNGTGKFEVGTCPGNTPICIEAREARALAHPTKEPTK